MVTEKRIAPYLQPLSPIPTGVQPRLRDLHGIRCVLFDIYGTLFISASGDISLSDNHGPATVQIASLLQRYGLPHDPDSLSEKLFSEIKQAHARMRKSGIDYPEIRIDRIWSTIFDIRDMPFIRRFAMEYEMIVNPVYPMPHLQETLKKIASNGILMGIISNAQFFTPCLFEWFLNADAAALGFKPDLVFYSYLAGRAKPSPVLFEEAASALGKYHVARNQILYIGNDMRNDILGAHAAGFATALFAGDARSLRLRTSDPECRDLLPDIVVTDLIQLAGCLGAA